MTDSKKGSGEKSERGKKKDRGRSAAGRWWWGGGGEKRAGFVLNRGLARLTLKDGDEGTGKKETSKKGAVQAEG